MIFKMRLSGLATLAWCLFLVILAVLVACGQTSSPTANNPGSPAGGNELDTPTPNFVPVVTTVPAGSTPTHTTPVVVPTPTVELITGATAAAINITISQPAPSNPQFTPVYHGTHASNGTASFNITFLAQETYTQGPPNYPMVVVDGSNYNGPGNVTPSNSLGSIANNHPTTLSLTLPCQSSTTTASPYALWVVALGWDAQDSIEIGVIGDEADVLLICS